MTLLEVLTNARTTLLAVHEHVFIRDAIPTDDNGQPVLPDRCMILDLIIDQKVRDFESVYGSILLQIGCWSPSVAQSLTDLEAARAALEGTGDWDMVRVNGTQTDPSGYRGATADFTALYDG